MGSGERTAHEAWSGGPGRGGGAGRGLVAAPEDRLRTLPIACGVKSASGLATRWAAGFGFIDRRHAVLYLHPGGNSACTPLISDFDLTWMVGAPVGLTASEMGTMDW